MAIGESAGFLLRIKADSSQADAEMRKFRQEFKAAESEIRSRGGILNQVFAGITKEMGLTGSQAATLKANFTQLATVTAAVAGGVAIVAGAAIGAGIALFKLASSVSEFGSTIFDASQKTGLSAETLSALKIAAEQSGSSFEALTNNISKFNVLLGQAATGSDKAQKILQQYGITATDTEGALVQAISTIAKMTSETDQAAAAAALFKDRTAAILPVIKSFDGDLPALLDKLRDLGLLMSKEDVEAADKFGDQMDTLTEQLEAVKRKIGIELMPVFLDMAQQFSTWLAANQGEVKGWGEAVANAIRYIADTWKKEKADLVGMAEFFDSMIAGDTWQQYRDKVATRIGLGNVSDSMGQLRQAEARLKDEMAKLKKEQAALAGGARFSDGSDEAAAAKAAEKARREAEREAKKAEREREAARRKAEQLEERDLAAAIRIEATNLQSVQKAMQAAYDAMRKTLSEGGAVEGFVEATNEATKQWAGNIQRSLVYLEELEKRALSKDATANERAELEQKQQTRRHGLKLDQDKEVEESQKKYWEEKLKRGEIEAERAQFYFEQEMEREEKRREALKLDQLPDLALPPILTPDAPPEAYDPFQAWIDSWTRFVDQIYADAPTLKQTIQSIGGIIAGAFQGMASAIGGVVQQWVLYGTTGPAVMRKVLAAALASIAAEAAVRAIWELALGFASLFFNPAEAVAHFTAAALFGSIAVGAALAGRAVAGNAFRQQTATATGATGSNTQGLRASAGAYSSLEPETREMGINRAAISGDINIKLGLNSDGVIEVLEQNARSNGRVRFLILDTVGNA